MILIIASRGDMAARGLSERWGHDRARVLTTDDLASPGWCVHTENPASSQAVAQGEAIAADDIAGVLTRLPSITETELPMIVAEDRAYAAREMTSFLMYWLSTLTCPVLNPPHASSLCGPVWRSEQWTMTARRLGLQVDPRRRRTPAFGADADTGPPTDPGQPPAQESVQVTVVGDRCIGTADGSVARQARSLADEAGVDLLTVLFSPPQSGSRFIDAHRWTNIHDEDVTDALLAHFESGGYASSRLGRAS